MSTHLEMQGNKGKHKGLEVLYEVIEDAKPLRVCGLGHVDQRADFRGLRWTSFVSPGYLHLDHHNM